MAAAAEEEEEEGVFPAAAALAAVVVLVDDDSEAGEKEEEDDDDEAKFDVWFWSPDACLAVPVSVAVASRTESPHAFVTAEVGSQWWVGVSMI